MRCSRPSWVWLHLTPSLPFWPWTCFLQPSFSLVHLCAVVLVLSSVYWSSLLVLLRLCVRIGFSHVAGCNKVTPKRIKKKLSPSFAHGSLCRGLLAMVLLCQAASGMPLAPLTTAEQERAFQRRGNSLVCTWAVRPQTREKRKIYLDRSRSGCGVRRAAPSKTSPFLLDFFIFGRF